MTHLVCSSSSSSSSSKPKSKMMAGLSLMSPNMNVIKSACFQNIELAEPECTHFQQLHLMHRLSKHTCAFCFLQASMSIHGVEVEGAAHGSKLVPTVCSCCSSTSLEEALACCSPSSCVSSMRDHSKQVGSGSTLLISQITKNTKNEMYNKAFLIQSTANVF